MPLPELSADLTVLLQIVFIDVALAGDNAIVVGMAVAGLPERQKRRAIVAGIAGATIVRVALGAFTLQLLDIIGLTLAGGILLLWVCWKMFRELWGRRDQDGEAERGQKSLLQAVTRIMVADVSMSLDNVLAVAGAAEGHGWVLAAGLTLSVILMGVAAGLIAKLLERHRWVAWLGLAIVLYVAVKMIWEGSHEVAASLPDGLTAIPRAGN